VADELSVGRKQNVISLRNLFTETGDEAPIVLLLRRMLYKRTFLVIICPIPSDKSLEIEALCLYMGRTSSRTFKAMFGIEDSFYLFHFGGREALYCSVTD